jgi:hypothetical protein
MSAPDQTSHYPVEELQNAVRVAMLAVPAMPGQPHCYD